MSEARRLADAAESRAQAAETAKIELSLQLAELAAVAESAADVSGFPSRTLDTAADDSPQADHLHRRWTLCLISDMMIIMSVAGVRSQPPDCLHSFCKNMH